MTFEQELPYLENLSPDQLRENLKPIIEILTGRIKNKNVEDIINRIQLDVEQLSSETSELSKELVESGQGRPLTARFLYWLLSFLVALMLTKTFDKPESVPYIIGEIQKKLAEKGLLEVPSLPKRIVTVEVLNVREKAEKTSRVVAIIKQDQIVSVITINKNWSYIEFCDEETGEDLRGWVFSRFTREVE